MFYLDIFSGFYDTKYIIVDIQGDYKYFP